jgi:hypothetical protein
MKMMTVTISSNFINTKKSFDITSVFPELQPNLRGFRNLEVCSGGNYFETTCTIFLIIVSVPGVINSYNQNGATPIATIPMIKIPAANFSFHVASGNFKNVALGFLP